MKCLVHQKGKRRGHRGLVCIAGITQQDPANVVVSKVMMHFRTKVEPGLTVLLWWKE